MTTIINASNGSTSGLITTADASGVLQLQTNNGTPALTLNTTQALGVGTSPAYGTSGQFLTSQGSAASPTWTTPSSGAMTLISTQTASSSASIAWTGLSGYTKYFLILDNLRGNAPVLQIGTGSTPTYLTSGYFYSGIYSNASAISYQSFQPFTTSNLSVTNGIPLISNGSASGSYTLTGLSTYFQLVGGGVTSSSTCIFNYVAGNVTSSNVTTAIQILCSSGTFTGTASLYGISS